MIISKAQIKSIASLKQAKFRDKENLFVVEGEKMVAELLHSSFSMQTICATKEWLQSNEAKISDIPLVLEVRDEDLCRISSLTTPNKVLAIVQKPNIQPIQTENELVIALDGINNPGNLGTILRLASWFGIKDVVCSENTTDVFNPKCVQATMGALFNVNVTYLNLCEFLSSLPKSYNVYGTIVDSQNNIYTSQLAQQGVIVIGSESHGISSQVRKQITHPLTIPNYSLNHTTESLNASIATAIVLSEFKRNTSKGSD